MVKYTYDAWGKKISTTGSLASTIGSLNPFRYKGYYYDQESEMYYCKSRYYVPDWCRWLNADSAYYLDQFDINNNSLFSYCCNDPICKIDVNGNKWNWSTFWKGVGLLATAVTAIALSVTTFGAGIPVAMAIIAGVTLTAGVLTGVNAVATIVEAGTDYNFVRDGLFNEVLGLEDSVYDVYSKITESVAAVGSMILGVYHTTGQYKAAKASQKYLGKGYSKAGKDRWISKDGLRQVRWDKSCHPYKGKPSAFHFNWEEFSKPIAKGIRNKRISDQHVFYEWFRYFFG